VKCARGFEPAAAVDGVEGLEDLAVAVVSAESVDFEVVSSVDSVAVGAASIGIADGSTLNRSPGFRRTLGLLT
jgi:hypothetical protein